MNNVTVGKYIPGYSFVHRLDPRVKLLLTIAIIVLVFLSSDFVYLGIILIPLVTLYAFSGLRAFQLIKLVFPVFFIGIFIFIINLFVIKSSETTTDIFQPISWWKITISEKAFLSAMILMVRMYVMMVAMTLMIATTKPTALTRAIEDLLLPLKLIRVKVHIIAMIISIALRFIPTLLEEAQRIMKAQASRGVDFKNGNVKAKIKSLVTLIIPLFVSAFAKAEDLANAMEVRGYDPYQKRIRYRVYYPNWRDLIISTGVSALIVVLVLTKNGTIILPSWK